MSCCFLNLSPPLHLLRLFKQLQSIPKADGCKSRIKPQLISEGEASDLLLQAYMHSDSIRTYWFAVFPPLPFQMDFQLVSIHLFIPNSLRQTSGSSLPALSRHGRGITVTFGDRMTRIDQLNLGQDPKPFSSRLEGPAALKSLVFLPGFRAKEFPHHQLDSASHPGTVWRQPWFRAAEDEIYSPLKKISKNTTWFIPGYLLDAECCCQEWKRIHLIIIYYLKIAL